MTKHVERSKQQWYYWEAVSRTDSKQTGKKKKQKTKEQKTSACDWQKHQKPERKFLPANQCSDLIVTVCLWAISRLCNLNKNCLPRTSFEKGKCRFKPTEKENLCHYLQPRSMFRGGRAVTQGETNVWNSISLLGRVVQEGLIISRIGTPRRYCVWWKD